MCLWRFESFIPSLLSPERPRPMVQAFSWLMGIAGVFTLALGSVHFFPLLLDFEHAIPDEGPPLKRFLLWPRRGGYAMQRSDVRGLARVMNHAASSHTAPPSV